MVRDTKTKNRLLSPCGGFWQYPRITTWCSVALTVLLTAHLGWQIYHNTQTSVPFLRLVIVVLLSASVGGLRPAIVGSVLWTALVLFATFRNYGPSTLTGGSGQALIGSIVVTLFSLYLGRMRCRYVQTIGELAAAPKKLEQQVRLRTRQLEEMENVLRSSELRYRSLLKAVPDAVIVLNNRFEIAIVNEQAEYLFGYRRDELYGQSLLRLIPERFHDAHRIYQENFIGSPHRRTMGIGLELAARRKDGSEFPTEVDLSFVHLPDGELLYMAVIRDITERKKLEIEREAHMHYREDLYTIARAGLNLLDTERIPEVFVDRVKNLLEADACYLTLWEADEHRTIPAVGYSEQRETSKAFSPLPGKQTLTSVALNLEHPLIIPDSDNSPYVSPEVRRRYPEQRALLVYPLISGRYKLGALIVAYHQERQLSLDLVERGEQAAIQIALALARAQLYTEVKHHAADLEREVAERVQELKRFFSLSLNLMAIADLEGKPIHLNPAWEKVLGYSPKELSVFLRRIAYPHDQETIDHLKFRLEQGVSIDSMETCVRKADGSNCWLLWTAVSDERKIYLVASDITSRRHLEDDLRKATEMAESAGRAKSEFMARISHELRTPLNAVIGFADILKNETFGELNNRQARYVDNIVASGQHLLSLVNDLLDLAKIESGREELELANVDIGILLPMVVDGLTPLSWQKNLTVQTATTPALPTIVADEHKVYQILVNLLGNAIKFTPEGGQVMINADVEKIGGDPFVRIVITDTGVGIDPLDQERIFDRFEQVDSVYTRAHDGTGLGLALTKLLVDLHGGDIKVESEGKGKGSTFIIRLPVLGRISKKMGEHR